MSRLLAWAMNPHDAEGDVFLASAGSPADNVWVARARVIYTVGYQGKTLAGLVAALVGASIKLVIDVRALPLSRRRGFSKTPLREGLSAAGIDYLHVREAGNPFREHRADVVKCLGLYRAHLEQHPEVIDDLLKAAESERAVLLCVEEHAHECHRSVLAAGIRSRARSIEIRDI
jgi:uncharacterized protein (DUF488 family)